VTSENSEEPTAPRVLNVPHGVATGVGPVAGSDATEAARFVVGELPELPHIPQLPDRGPWAQAVGRTSAVLIDLPIELDVGRWRAVARESRDGRRARSLLAQDLDAVEEQWAGYTGMAKAQIGGPISTAANVELRSGDALVSDTSAFTDLTVSLSEGVVQHLNELQRRVPGAHWCLQVDEPQLALVTRGSVPRASGWGRLPPVSTSDASALLHQVIDAGRANGASVIVNCCDTNGDSEADADADMEVDWTTLRSSDPDAVVLSLHDADLNSPHGAAALEEWWAGGRGLWCGVDPLDPDAAHSLLRRTRSIVGATPQGFTERVVVVAVCAAADVSAQAYAGTRAVTQRLVDDQ